MNATAHIAIVIPVYRDDEALAELLSHLDGLATCPEASSQELLVEVIVVDGAASATTANLAEPFATCLCAPAGRGLQISAGIEASVAPYVWVLHADCRPSVDAWQEMLSIVNQGSKVWGRFQVDMPQLPVIAAMMNWRSRLTRICTGDQAMFFHRSLLVEAGGFPRQPLMEDVEVSKLMKRTSGTFVAATGSVRASPRRWQSSGVVRTVMFMWWTRLRYFCGVSAQVLFDDYYRGRQ